MRTARPTFFGLLLLTLPASAQTTAGEVPTGYSVSHPGIDLQLNMAFTMDSASFDVDCDGVPDIRAVLFQGEPAIDAPNACALNLLNPELALCTDPPQFYWRPQYHAFGSPLDCTGNFTWRNDSITVLGDVGGFSAIGPFSMDSTYVAYRNGTQVGWILLSFDLTNGGGLGDPVQLQIHQVLRPCLPTSVDERIRTTALRIYPNPLVGEVLRFESAAALRSIELLDVTGKLIDQFNGTVRTIPSPEKAGIYLLRATQLDGRSSVVRFVRY